MSALVQDAKQSAVVTILVHTGTQSSWGRGSKCSPLLLLLEYCLMGVRGSRGDSLISVGN